MNELDAPRAQPVGLTVLVRVVGSLPRAVAAHFFGLHPIPLLVHAGGHLVDGTLDSQWFGGKLGVEALEFLIGGGAEALVGVYVHERAGLVHLFELASNGRWVAVDVGATRSVIEAFGSVPVGAEHGRGGGNWAAALAR